MRKTASLPPIRVETEFREAAENVLAAGETLSSFIETSIRAAVSHRQAQAEFLSRGLAARDAARASGDYVSARDVLEDLRQRLDSAKTKANPRS